MKISHATFINCSIEELFAFITQVENQPKWQKKTVATRLSPPGPMDVGSTITVVTGVLGAEVEKRFEITEYLRNRRISWKVLSNSAISGSWNFDMVGEDKTLFQETYERRGFFVNLVKPLLGRILTRTTKSNLATLKDLLES